MRIDQLMALLSVEVHRTTKTVADKNQLKEGLTNALQELDKFTLAEIIAEVTKSDPDAFMDELRAEYNLEEEINMKDCKPYTMGTKLHRAFSRAFRTYWE